MHKLDAAMFPIVQHDGRSAQTLSAATVTCMHGDESTFVTGGDDGSMQVADPQADVVSSHAIAVVRARSHLQRVDESDAGVEPRSRDQKKPDQRAQWSGERVAPLFLNHAPYS
jgi:hypothetical protein